MCKGAEQLSQFVAEDCVGYVFMVLLMTSSVHCYVDIRHIIRFITNFSAIVCLLVHYLYEQKCDSIAYYD